MDANATGNILEGLENMGRFFQGVQPYISQEHVSCKQLRLDFVQILNIASNLTSDASKVRINQNIAKYGPEIQKIVYKIEFGWKSKDWKYMGLASAQIVDYAIGRNTTVFFQSQIDIDSIVGGILQEMT